ncbi:hypothetical protein XENORESO_006983 [Xenotaenia resolanae]|uniref:Uncharacterized protein n=1 Tax=Xenotaenia resolanae TaxID=208358 RepID=A0ABV0W9I6_9TELE
MVGPRVQTADECFGCLCPAAQGGGTEESAPGPGGPAISQFLSCPLQHSTAVVSASGSRHSREATPTPSSATVAPPKPSAAPPTPSTSWPAHVTLAMSDELKEI